jgi:hypothetical protein
MADKPIDFDLVNIVLGAQEIVRTQYAKLRVGIVPTGEGEARKLDLSRKIMRKALLQDLQERRVDPGAMVDAGGDSPVPLTHYITKHGRGGGGGIAQYRNAVKDLSTNLDDIAAKAGVTADGTATTTTEDGEEVTTFVDDAQEALVERRFQEQCFLIDNYERVVQNNMLNPYGNFFTCVSIDQSRVVSRISSTEDITPFVDLEPHEIAGLHPQLRFFKVVPVGAGKTVDKEIIYKDSTSKTSINEYFSNHKGRSDGVGVKKFTWKYIGQTDVEVERSILCKLVLTFRNIEDLDSSDINKKFEASFLDMLLWSPSSTIKKVKNPFGVPFDQWDPTDYEIKVVAGWSAPPPKDNLVSNKLRKYLQTQSVTMHLALLGHTFNFKDDGSGTVEIEFQGRIDAQTNNPNTDIFNMGASFKKGLAKRKKRLEKLRKKAKVSRARADEGGDFLEDTADYVAEHVSFEVTDDIGADFSDTVESKSVSAKARAAEAEVARLEENLDTFVTSEKTRRYQLLLQRLYDSGNLRYIDLPEEQVNLLQEGQRTRKQAAIMRKYGGTTKDDTPKKPKRKLLDFEINRINSSSQNANNPNSDGENDPAKKLSEKTAKAMAKASEEPAGKEGETDAAREDKLNANVTDAQKELQSSLARSADTYRITYLYLGDLLESAFSLLGNLDDKDTIRYLLGEITMIDPLTSGVVAFNLADVPISLILFLEWYNNKAIKTQRDSWPIKQFIKDVVNDLVIAALSPECFAGYNSSPNLYITYVEGPGDGAGKDRVKNNKRNRITRVGQIKKHPARRTSALAKAGKIYSYNLITAHNAPSVGLTGNANRDAKRGIYHFYAGRDRGILKSIKYSKRDMPHVKAARTQMDGVDPISAQLRENYTVNMTTIGSTLFRPMNYVFVHPRVSGGTSSRSRSLTVKMGLAGYVFITTAECIIEPGRFETRLEGYNDGMVGMSAATTIPVPKRVSGGVSLTSTSVGDALAERGGAPDETGAERERREARAETAGLARSLGLAPPDAIVAASRAAAAAGAPARPLGPSSD